MLKSVYKWDGEVHIKRTQGQRHISVQILIVLINMQPEQAEPAKTSQQLEDSKTSPARRTTYHRSNIWRAIGKGIQMTTVATKTKFMYTWSYNRKEKLETNAIFRRGIFYKQEKWREMLTTTTKALPPNHNRVTDKTPQRDLRQGKCTLEKVNHSRHQVSEKWRMQALYYELLAQRTN